MAFQTKEQQDQYYQDNKAKFKSAYEKHKRENPKYRADYYQQNKEIYRERDKAWKKSKRDIDPIYRLMDTFRSRLYKVLGQKRSKHTKDIFGCTLDELKAHLESQFEPWMSWDNWGGRLVIEQNASWDVDHIIPLSSAQSEEEIYKLNHYTNLRPLCSYVNRFIKRDNI